MASTLAISHYQKEATHRTQITSSVILVLYTEENGEKTTQTCHFLA